MHTLRKGPAVSKMDMAFVVRNWAGRDGGSFCHPTNKWKITVMVNAMATDVMFMGHKAGWAMVSKDGGEIWLN